jgi:hypothetical protein
MCLLVQQYHERFDADCRSSGTQIAMRDRHLAFLKSSPGIHSPFLITGCPFLKFIFIYFGQATLSAFSLLEVVEHLNQI